ncbi:MAG: ATP-binding cassette domain-containing protein [Clostridiaceae bacterium]
MQIEVSSLKKTFKVNKKKEGLVGSIQGLFSREYRIAEAVKDVSLSIREGECIGFIGPNGAGKTTTIKMLTGLIHPTSGQAKVLGYTPWERKNDFKRQISLVMGNKFQLTWDLPAIESFELHRKIYDIPYNEYRQRLGELSDILNVSNLTHVPVRNLSLGERMKMELITSLLHKPKVLFLDEPTIGLDSASQKSIRKFLREFNSTHKTTIIMTSHYMDDIESVCDRLLMISKGEIIYDGQKEHLIEKFKEEININVKLSAPLNKDELKNQASILKYENDECSISVPKNQYLKVIQFLLSTGKVKDLNISEMPLEYVVEKCYVEREGVS